MKRIVSFVLILSFAFLLCSCGSTPDKVVSSFCDALKLLDVDSMNQLCTNDEFSLDTLENSEIDALTDFIKENAEKISYEITNSDNDGQNGTVNVKFTYTDARQAFSEAIAEYISQMFALAFSGSSDDDMESLLYDILAQKFASCSFETTSEEVTFKCIKENSTWKIQSIPDELLNIVSCGIYDIADELSNSFDENADISSSQESIETKDTNYVEGNGYKVEVLNAELVTTENGNSIVLTFNFTNNNSEPKTIMDVSSLTVFQNGVEMINQDWLITDYDLDTAYTNIKDGATIQVYASRMLSNDADPIEVEISLYDTTTYSVVDKTSYTIDLSSNATENDDMLTTTAASIDDLPQAQLPSEEETPIISIYNYTCDITSEKNWPAVQYPRDADYVFKLTAIINDDNYANLPIAWTVDRPEAFYLEPDSEDPSVMNGYLTAGGTIRITASCGDASTTITLWGC